MTVAELIEALKALPQEASVWIDRASDQAEPTKVHFEPYSLVDEGPSVLIR